VLLSADYPVGDVILTLIFDRAIDYWGLSFTDLVVFDGFLPAEMGGTADITPIGDYGFSIVMIDQGTYAGPDTLLNAPGGAGIVAAAGGAPWDGVVNLLLPFPP
jgi:hypothetical protein